MSKRKIEREEKLKNLRRKKKEKKERADTVKTDVSKKQISSNWLSFVKSNDPNAPRLKMEREPPTRKIGRKPEITKVVAIDCEMVADENDRDMLARVSLVNFKLECIYDEFVRTPFPVADYRTRFSGIRPADLEKGKDFKTVQREVRNLISNRILIGHALTNDFKVLKLKNHPRKLIRDTSKYEPFKKFSDNKTPALKKLAKEILNENIQEGEHSSVEDAMASMRLYKKFRGDWESSLLKSNRPKMDERVQIYID